MFLFNAYAKEQRGCKAPCSEESKQRNWVCPYPCVLEVDRQRIYNGLKNCWLYDHKHIPTLLKICIRGLKKGWTY